jgi:hypothetical protein
MPIIINGGSYSAGGWWSKHLQKAETNERVEIVGFANLSADTIPDAFREMEALAAGTRCKNYFYQANINPRADEHLTPAQRDEAIETLERNLGLTGQPRFVVEHQKEGRTHWHVVWSRIDTEKMQAIPDSLTAVIHERTSRELEIKFDLERGQSVLVANREHERPERRPQKNETLRAAETGVDLETVKADAQAARQRADNGQSFRAALEASGDYVLARGDRRDFVIIDHTGDDHSLARRLGMKAAELRAYMADLDPASLPSVDQAKAVQAAREAVREAVREAQERGQHGRAADGQGREDRPTSSGPQNAPQPDYAAVKGRRDDIGADLASELQRAAQPAQGIEQVVENAVDTGDRVATGMLGGAAKLVGRIAEALADMISPTPPPTKEQVQQQQRAEEAERPLRETARSKAEWEARLMAQLQDDLRKRARQREEGYDRDDDYGGRERERER